MSGGERYVVLGAARAQVRWFDAVARWANAGALPVEFEKAVSADELRVRLGGGRRYSAVLVDSGLVGWDRDVAERAATQGCAVVAVADRAAAERWRGVGADAVLEPDFSRDELLTTLQQVAEPVARMTAANVLEAPTSPRGDGWRGRLVAVTGGPGSGRSTLTMAVAGGLARDPRQRGLVLLADLALHAQQGLLHDAGDVVPGISELVDAHRSTRLPADEIRQMCFQAGGRGYDLLLGLRRQRDWTALRPAAVVASLDAVRQAYRTVVADVDPEVDGEAECGSVDVEERNTLARRAIGDATLVLVVGLPTVPGVHAHVRVVRQLLDFGVEAERLVTVVNRAPRRLRAQAKLARSLAGLLEVAAPGRVPVVGPLFVPERRGLDDLLAAGEALPSAMTTPLGDAVAGLLDLVGADDGADAAGSAHGSPVAPGSLGSWGDLAEDGVR